METDLTLSRILAHLGLSLVPWLIVMLAGGGIGYLLAILFRRWFQGHPRAFDLMVFLPWRSIAVLIALVAINTPFTIWNFGLDPLSTSVTIGVALSVLFVPWITSIFLYSEYPISTRRKVLSLVRTFTILSIVLPVFLQAGVGYFIYQVSFNLDTPNMILGYEVVGAMMLGVDLIVGLVQYVLGRSRPA